MEPTHITTDIMEPTLNSQAGHCHALVSALSQAHPGGAATCRAWAHRDLTHHGLSPSAVRNVFTRRGRHLQVARRAAAAMRRNQVVLSTATTSDLLGIHLLRPLGIRRPGALVLYVHWYYPKPRKDRFLRRFFKRHPGVVVLAPTRSTVEHLTRLGAKRIELVEYPFAGLTERAAATAARTPTTRPAVMAAGAARMDKGLPITVDLIDTLQRDGRDVEVRIQASPTHWGDIRPDVAAELDRLEAIQYAGLIRENRTLTDTQFREFVRDGIALLPYDAEMFHDRVSGVAVDAIIEGSPIITSKGSWMADLVDRLGAGIVVDGRDVSGWRDAVDAICDDWAGYRSKAVKAAAELARIHQPSRFWDAVARQSA